jgi:hypothetical protein
VKYLANDVVKQVLRRATPEQKRPIFDQLEIKQYPDYPDEHIVRRVCRAGEHGFSSFFSDEEPMSYLTFLDKLIRQLEKKAQTGYDRRAFDEIDLGSGSTRAMSTVERRELVLQELNRLERLLINLLIERAFESLSQDQRTQFEREFTKRLQEQDVGYKYKFGGIAAILVAGDLAGFSAYTALSSLIHAVTLGTAGFGVYASASSLLSYALGPIGWSSLAGYFIYQSGTPKLKQLLPIGLAIAALQKR